MQADSEKLVARYVAMWHETNPERRSDIVRDLFAPDAENIATRFHVRGIDDLIKRVDRAHDEWVASRGFIFEPAGNTDGHHNLIKFFWRMLPKDGGPVEANGLDIFVLREDGRIQALYQFTEPD